MATSQALFTSEFLATAKANLPLGHALLQDSGIGSLTEEQIGVLRQFVEDGDFRKAYLTDHVGTLSRAGYKFTGKELGVLSRISPAQYNTFYNTIQQMRASGDGTHTLAYAIVLAVVIAALVALQAEPSPAV